MTTAGFKDLADRFSLANELHARPFPSLDEDGAAICLALKTNAGQNGSARDDFNQLIALLDRYGADHPPAGANHHWTQLGRFRLKWERHTEFQTYTVFHADSEADPEDIPLEVFPGDWRDNLDAELIAATIVEYHRRDNEDLEDISKRFERESLAVSQVIDASATIAGDFRIDGNGFVRFVVQASTSTGPLRLGRIVQRVYEIETYRAMAMLSLPSARAVGSELGKLGPQLSEVVERLASDAGDHDASLNKLLGISARLEDLNARHASRFSAAEAYSAIVAQRLDVLREERVAGRQTFAEFMNRRFEPAMRTCASTNTRLGAMAGQAARAGDMLRTRTDVDRAQQNQEILARMDERAAQQLKLQKTVEGLSVVAVSYYSVSLASYILEPLATMLSMSKASLTAIITLPIVFLVWLMIRSIRKHL